MMRRLHIVLLAWCWVLLTAAVPASASVSLPHAEPCPPEDLRAVRMQIGDLCATRLLSADLRSLLPAELAASNAPEATNALNAPYAADAPAACVDRASAEEWLCERSCNSDLEPPRPVGELTRHRGASDGPRTGDSLSRTVRPAPAFGVRRAAAYRRTFDSRLLSPSGGDCLVRFGRLLI